MEAWAVAQSHKGGERGGRRGRQLKDQAQLDGWLRDGSAAYVEGLCVEIIELLTITLIGLQNQLPANSIEAEIGSQL